MLQRLLLIICLASSYSLGAATLQTGVLPGFSMRGQAIGVMRMNARFLFGGDFFKIGPYGDFQTLAPQTVDSSYGGALRLGIESFVELQMGYFSRSFKQEGSEDKNGKGLAANLIYGMNLSPHLGVDVTLSAKRISSGSLDKRLIVDLLPLIAIRSDF